MTTLPSRAARWIPLALLFMNQWSIAQQCSNEALSAKYWQYRDNLNRHFLMNDRKPEGCIGNGITRNESTLNTLNCNTDLLHGYGMPATSINMAPNGAVNGMGDRNIPGPNNPFYDTKCANYPADLTIEGTSNGNQADGVPKKYNSLEFGSEAPHQLGWYLVTLATEYELLRQNGQIEAQQRTLEDIFLALQAYRRLDITANCLVKSRYNEITDGFEATNCEINGILFSQEGTCLCSEKYHNKQCDGDSKWHFDIPCKQECDWEPDLSGYSGFFIREDATQEQEKLHDASEDRWNIDVVGGAFAMSQIPPCENNFSPACYMEHHTGFLSQDQLFLVMVGLGMIKRYIPEDASITTCNGTTYHPLAIAQDIAKGMVDLPNNNTRHIFWPGSDDDDCCFKSVKFSECAGGNLQYDYAGLQMMYNYINPADKRSIRLLDRVKFGAQNKSSYLSNNANFNFAIFSTAIGADIPSLSPFLKEALTNYSNQNDKEIYLLMNNLLHPEGNQLSLDKAIFEAMLCEAPCEGVCIMPSTYDNNTNSPYPSFKCANTPKWTGQRWEGQDAVPNWGNGSVYQARQFNGLDYMALYNIYMLHYPEEQTSYYNPLRPEPITNGHFLGEDKIEGPTTLCPGQNGIYTIDYAPNNGPLRDILEWTSSTNIQIISREDVAVFDRLTVRMNAPLSPSFVQVKGFENNHLDQHWNQGNNTTVVANAVSDHCDFTYRKPILSETPDYAIFDSLVPCYPIGFARATTANLADGVSIAWTATDSKTGWTLAGTGPSLDFSDIIAVWPAGAASNMTITMTVQTDCGFYTKSKVVPYVICHPGGNQRQILIAPNPANNQISVRIAESPSQDFVSNDPNGIRIRVYPANGGTNAVMDTYLYSNGQYFNVSSLPNGVYQVRASASDLFPIQTNLAILR